MPILVGISSQVSFVARFGQSIRPSTIRYEFCFPVNRMERLSRFTGVNPSSLRENGARF